MAPSIPPVAPRQPVQPQPQPMVQPPQPVLSPKQWERALKVQRMTQILPEHVGSGMGGLELRPRNVHFETQNKGEKVFILLRRHFITNIGWIISNVFYLTLPFLLYLILQIFQQNIFELFSAKFTTLLLLTFYTLVATNILRHFVDWYFNIYIVTDERVINYAFKPFVSRDITELTLEDIEDIREENVGVLASFFNFGNVSVFTAADQSVITFYYIPSPMLVRDKISDLSKIVKSMRNES
jgi:hypothetical protein